MTICVFFQTFEDFGRIIEIVVYDTCEVAAGNVSKDTTAKVIAREMELQILTDLLVVQIANVDNVIDTTLTQKCIIENIDFIGSGKSNETFQRQQTIKDIENARQSQERNLFFLWRIRSVVSKIDFFYRLSRDSEFLRNLLDLLNNDFSLGIEITSVQYTATVDIFHCNK